MPYRIGGCNMNMRPVNGFIMMKKRSVENKNSGIVLPDGETADEIMHPGFDVLAVADGVSIVKPGDVVYVDAYAGGAVVNGVIFCKETSIVSVKEAL